MSVAEITDQQDNASSYLLGSHCCGFQCDVNRGVGLGRRHCIQSMDCVICCTEVLRCFALGPLICDTNISIST